MSEPDLSTAATFDHWVDERVRFSDTDLVGHVNNVAIAAYVESGRVGFASQLLHRVHEGGGLVTLRRVEIDYLAELHYPAELRVGSRLLALGRTSITVGTGVFEQDRCVATSRAVLVALGDGGPAPLSDDIRRELEAELPPQHERSAAGRMG